MVLRLNLGTRLKRRSWGEKRRNALNQIVERFFAGQLKGTRRKCKEPRLWHYNSLMN